MKKTNIRFAERLKELREAAGVSMAELARAIEVSKDVTRVQSSLFFRSIHSLYVADTKKTLNKRLFPLVRRTRLELVRCYPQASETCASANFATPARPHTFYYTRGGLSSALRRFFVF